MTDYFSAGPSNDESPVSDIEAGPVGRHHKKRKGRAQANRFYSDGDVMACFGVSRNTLGSWCKAGLRSLKGEGPRLFLGRDLIAFDHARRNRPAHCREWHEVHCVCCKGWHSLLEVTMNAVMFHLLQLRTHLKETDFARVTPDEIAAYKHWLTEERGDADGHAKGYSASTIVHTLGDAKAFFEWLVRQRGYKSMDRDLPEYFTPSKRHSALARVAREKVIPTPEQLRLLLEMMPVGTWSERRNRAVIALLFLTGARDGAAISLRMKHIDVEVRRVFQDATEVNTKFSKTMTTEWFPVGEHIERIVIDWLEERRADGASADAPVLPRAPNPFEALQGPRPEAFWKTATSVRAILKTATAAAGIAYFHPHAIRDTLATMFGRMANTLEEMGALSQNLGHEHFATTRQNYGRRDPSAMRGLFDGMRNRKPQPDIDKVAEKFRQAPAHLQNAIRSILNVQDKPETM